MKVPPVFPQTPISHLALIGVLSLAAAVALAEPQPAIEASLEAQASADALAYAAEMDALSAQQSKLESDLDAMLAPKFDSLSEQPLKESMGSLAAVHDARLRQQIRLNSRIDQQLVSLGRTPSNEYDAFSADRAVMIVITPIPASVLVD